MRWLLIWLRFNHGCDRIGVAAVLKTADLPPADILVSLIVFWLVWVGFLLSGVDVLGFTALEGMVRSFALFVPRLLVAIVILVLGVVCANFAWRATLIAAVNARVPSPRVVSGAVRALVLILAGAMALDQIALARTIVLTAFAIAFGAVMLGLAIAFGVGGGGIARRILDHWFPEHPPRRAGGVPAPLEPAVGGRVGRRRRGGLRPAWIHVTAALQARPAVTCQSLEARGSGRGRLDHHERHGGADGEHEQDDVEHRLRRHEAGANHQRHDEQDVGEADPRRRPPARPRAVPSGAAAT